jgi:hypothetical protein
MKRLDYTFATTLDGRTIKHKYGWPFYVLCSGNSTFTVLGPHEVVIGRYSSMKYATRIASNANKEWYKDLSNLYNKGVKNERL